ncbi:hypothetical protein [Paenibacillus naphthalenovorans]|uniref:hypothetical protein n=1 Tax=Paenibacillus naphthalenovorans TaxID=162209 RepID=UPI0011145C4A|nr:hypothetical protein [Paenibacillus naphthalenovorans]
MNEKNFVEMINCNVDNPGYKNFVCCGKEIWSRSQNGDAPEGGIKCGDCGSTFRLGGYVNPFKLLHERRKMGLE